MLKVSLKTLITAIYVMVLWGALFPLIKLGYTAFAIETSFIPNLLLFAGLRFTICGVLITMFAVKKGEPMNVASSKEWRYIAFVGLFAVILHYSFTYVGLSTTESGATSLLKQLGVLLFIPFSFLFDKEDIFSVLKIAGAVLGLCGILALNGGPSGIEIGLGEILIIGASFCTVIANLLGKSIMKTVSPITMTGYSQSIGGIVLLCAGIITGGKIGSISGYAVLIFTLICVCSTVSYCLWYIAAKSNGLSGLFAIKMLEPLFAAIIAGFVLRENPFKPQFVLAFLLTAAAVLVTNIRRNQVNTD